MGSKQSANEIWPIHVILQKKKIYQNFLQNLQPENYIETHLCLQRIKHNLYWKMKILNQATYIRDVIAKLSTFVQISMHTSSDSFIHMIL